jgi:hypothetical protein
MYAIAKRYLEEIKQCFSPFLEEGFVINLIADHKVHFSNGIWTIVVYGEYETFYVDIERWTGCKLESYNLSIIYFILERQSCQIYHDTVHLDTPSSVKMQLTFFADYLYTKRNLILYNHDWVGRYKRDIEEGKKLMRFVYSLPIDHEINKLRYAGDPKWKKTAIELMQKLEQESPFYLKLGRKMIEVYDELFKYR